MDIDIDFGIGADFLDTDDTVTLTQLDTCMLATQSLLICEPTEGSKNLAFNVST